MTSKQPKDDTHLNEEEQQRRQIEINQPLIALLDSWMHEDVDVDQERAEFIEFMRGIDENRGSERKLYQDLLKCLD